MDNLSMVLSTRAVMQGQLYKYTNVVKGFQLRQFRVDAENGILSYYLCENNDESIPRGQVDLHGALVNPSDEECRIFTINPAVGDVIKLKANDVKSRQEWIQKLRAVIDSLSKQSRSSLPPKENLAAFDCILACRKQLQDTEKCNSELSKIIESFDNSSPDYKDFLLLKALSASVTSTLSQAFGHLQKYHESNRTDNFSF